MVDRRYGEQRLWRSLSLPQHGRSPQFLYYLVSIIQVGSLVGGGNTEDNVCILDLLFNDLSRVKVAVDDSNFRILVGQEGCFADVSHQG